ncbi:hypothetical protein HED60_09925 [Planctomycetales bacterium ZRK34]|nr:hypothetical protein HED60_09925 [Planctomycetales bacterium ZRK34]
MTGRPAENHELFQLTERLCEQTATAEDIHRLNALLVDDPEARRAYLHHISLHGELHYEQAGADRDYDAPTLPAAATAPPVSRRAAWYSAAALAAAVTLAATIWVMSPTAPPAGPSTANQSPHVGTVAMLSDRSDDAVFAEPTGAPALGAELTPGPIHLLTGKAQVMFHSTAVVDLIGPCVFEMTGANRGRLTTGRIVAFVPKKARGFTLDLPGGAQIVDLGTAFEVDVHRQGAIDLTVTQGVVQIVMPESADVASRIVQIDAPQKLRLQPTAGIVERYFSKLQAAADASTATADTPPINFNQYTLQSYDDQDGKTDQPTASRVSNDGRSLHLRGNCWKAIPVDYLVKPSTVVEFELMVTDPGEAVGFGFDDDGLIRKGCTMFTLTGTDMESVTVLRHAFHIDNLPPIWMTYRIPVGRFDAGKRMNQLVFYADDDTTGKAEAVFRNVRIVEGPRSKSPTENDAKTTHVNSDQGDDPQ